MSQVEFWQQIVQREKRNQSDRQPAGIEKMTCHPLSWDLLNQWLERRGIKQATSPSETWDWSVNIYRDAWATPEGVLRVWYRGGGYEDVALEEADATPAAPPAPPP